MVTFGIFSAASGTLAALGLLFPQVWFLSVVGLLPFLCCLHKLTREDVRHASTLGLVFGVFYCCTALIWFWHVLPLDKVPISLWKSIVYVGASWAVVSVVMGFFFVMFSSLFVKYRKNDKTDIVYAASLWTLIQYAQMWGFALLTASNSIQEAHFSPALLGNALAHFSPLLQFASLGGAYLLTFMAVALAVILYRLIFSGIPKSRIAVLAIIGISVIVLTEYDKRFYIVPSHTDGPALRMALVTTDFGMAFSRDEQKRRAEATEKILLSAANSDVDIVVLPEGTDYFTQSKKDPDQIRNELFERKTAFIDSGVTRVDNKRLVEMRFFDSDKWSAVHRKVFLVPQGEFSPWPMEVLLNMLSVSDDELRVLRERTVGHATTATAGVIAGTKVGALFCSEILSPSLYRDLAHDGAQIFINPASHAWFNGSPLVETVTLTMAKVRAVENGRFIAIAGNKLPSYVLSDTGELLRRATDDEPILIASVPLRSDKTLYTLLGEYGALLIIGLIGFVAQRHRINA